MKCSKCGAVIDADAKFCAECGEKVVLQKKCPKCNAPMQPEDVFCGECGYKLVSEAPMQPQNANKSGDAETYYQNGEKYYYGQGVEKNYAEAVKGYREAAAQGHTDAQYSLGYCYNNGQGVEKNYAEAVKWYTKAAEQGNAAAQRMLGVCYEFGKGTIENYNKALVWYQKAAENGHKESQYKLGEFYYYGRSVEKDYAEAVKWYREAAAQGHTDAQYSLGYCYNKGQGVPENSREAQKWWKLAAERGHAKAHYEIIKALCDKAYYIFRHKDMNEGERLLQEAENLCTDATRTLVGNTYHSLAVDRKVLAKDPTWIKFEQKGAEYGDKSSMKRLGDYHYENYNKLPEEAYPALDADDYEVSKYEKLVAKKKKNLTLAIELYVKAEAVHSLRTVWNETHNTEIYPWLKKYIATHPMSGANEKDLKELTQIVNSIEEEKRKARNAVYKKFRSTDCSEISFLGCRNEKRKNELQKALSKYVNTAEETTISTKDVLVHIDSSDIMDVSGCVITFDTIYAKDDDGIRKVQIPQNPFWEVKTKFLSNIKTLCLNGQPVFTCTNVSAKDLKLLVENSLNNAAAIKRIVNMLKSSE